MKLKGKVALVTGAGQGIGKSIALKFAAEGADLALFDINRDTCTETAQDCHALGKRCEVFAVDVANRERVQRACEEVFAVFGGVDILVNNAGMSVYGSFVEQKAADWRAMIETNLMGTIFCTHAILPSMLERGQGLIINISSVAGIHGLPNEAVYCASKHGVKGFTDALAVELKDKGIRVCGIYPGGMDTPFWDVQTYHGDRSRIMDPAKVAEMVLAMAVQPQGTLVREVILFPTNEWH